MKNPKEFKSKPFDIQQEFMERMNISSPVIFDVGANRGQTARRYCKHFPESKLYCFEPFPETVNSLRQEVNHLSNVTVVPMAVSSTSGRREFFVNGSHATNSLLPRNTNGRRYFPSEADFKLMIEVDVTSIDEFMIEQDIKHIDILKFDIQGGELMALQGAMKALQNRAISVIYTEIFFVHHYQDSPLFHNLWQHLDQFQYSLFDIYHLRRAKNGQLRFGDALFVSPQVRQDIVDNFSDED